VFLPTSLKNTAEKAEVLKPEVSLKSSKEANVDCMF